MDNPSGAPFGTGSHAAHGASFAVSALSGFDPSRGRIRTLANIIASFEAENARAERALADAEEILRDIKENHL